MRYFASIPRRLFDTNLDHRTWARNQLRSVHSPVLFFPHRTAFSGYILCDLPAHGDVAFEIFGDRPASPPQQAAQTSDTAAASATDAAAGAARPKSRGGGGEGSDGSSSPSTSANPASAAAAGVTAGQPDEIRAGIINGMYRPTHVVYLDASLEYILAQQERRGEAGAAGGAGGKDPKAKLRDDLERYFAQEQQQQQGELPDGGSTPVEKTAAPGGKQPQSNAGPSGGERKVGSVGTGDGAGGRAEGRWVPATARVLEDLLKVEVEVVDVEGAGGGGGSGDGDAPGAAVVSAVDNHLCGGEVPAFVAMLSEGGHGEATAADAVASGAEGGPPAVDKHGALDPTNTQPVDNGGEKNSGDGDGVGDGDGNDDESSEPLTTDSSADDQHPLGDLSLTEVMAKLTARDAREVELRTRRHRNFLTNGVVPQVAAGLVAAAEARPENIFEFLAEYLIR